MLLCIDIGNTNVVLAVYAGNEILAEFIVESNLYQTADEYGIKIMDMFNYNNLDFSKITGVIIASVVPGLDSVFEKTIKKYLNLEPLFVGPGVKSGIRIKTDNPKQLGADILVGAVAAYHKYGAPVIIIDMGTAITLFYVDHEKELVGGIIVPGIRTSYAGLFSKTSRLEEVRAEKPLNVIGKDTVTCIQSGMIYGTASMIDGLIRKMKKELQKDALVVITGGEALAIKDFLEEEVIYDRHLIMEGLRIIFNRNN
jgi:type III pantothenate kinase